MFVWLFLKLKVCEKTKSNIRLFVACLDKRCFLQDPLSGAGEFVLLEGSKLGCCYRLEAAIRGEQGTDVGLRVNVQNGLMWEPSASGRGRTLLSTLMTSLQHPVWYTDIPSVSDSSLSWQQSLRLCDFHDRISMHCTQSDHYHEGWCNVVTSLQCVL